MQMKEVLINVDLSVLILSHDMVLLLRTGTKINKEGKGPGAFFNVYFAPYPETYFLPTFLSPTLRLAELRLQLSSTQASII